MESNWRREVEVEVEIEVDESWGTTSATGDAFVALVTWGRDKPLTLVALDGRF